MEVEGNTSGDAQVVIEDNNSGGASLTLLVGI